MHDDVVLAQARNKSPVALTATIYNIDIDLADADRGVYESLALRVARHPSESEEYLVTRILAYALEFHEGIAFSGDSVLGRGSRDGGMPLIFYPDQYRRSLGLVQELRQIPDGFPVAEGHESFRGVVGHRRPRVT